MKLPPLNALRAFEAAARAGSFTTAGRELSVSSAAVSQQVRKLELYLNRKLFFRNNNQLLLTDAGRDLYINAASALNQISSFTEGILTPKGPRPLVISALPSLADRWLPSVLAAYDAAPVVVRAEEDPIELEQFDVDIRLSYGDDSYAEYWSAPLFTDRLVPMATPQAVDEWEQAPGDLSALRLIHMDWGPSFSKIPSWTEWATAQGWTTTIGHGITVPGGAAALALAEAGGGIALGQMTLARASIADGRLICLSETSIAMPASYMVIVTNARRRQPRIRAFLELIQKG